MGNMAETDNGLRDSMLPVRNQTSQPSATVVSIGKFGVRMCSSTYIKFLEKKVIVYTVGNPTNLSAEWVSEIGVRGLRHV